MKRRNKGGFSLSSSASACSASLENLVLNSSRVQMYLITSYIGLLEIKSNHSCWNFRTVLSFRLEFSKSFLNTGFYSSPAAGCYKTHLNYGKSGLLGFAKGVYRNKYGGGAKFARSPSLYRSSWGHYPTSTPPPLYTPLGFTIKRH